MALRRALLALAVSTGAVPARADDAAKTALATALNGKIASCWSPATTDMPDRVQEVRIKLSLTRSGALDGAPVIEGRIGGDDATKGFAASALRAVVRCAPYSGLAQLAPYADWKTMVVTFKYP